VISKKIVFIFRFARMFSNLPEYVTHLPADDFQAGREAVAPLPPSPTPMLNSEAEVFSKITRSVSTAQNYTVYSLPSIHTCKTKEVDFSMVEGKKADMEIYHLCK